MANETRESLTSDDVKAGAVETGLNHNIQEEPTFGREFEFSETSVYFKCSQDDSDVDSDNGLFARETPKDRHLTTDNLKGYLLSWTTLRVDELGIACL